MDNSRTTLGQLLDDSWTTLRRLLDNSRTTLGRLLGDSWTKIGRLLARTAERSSDWTTPTGRAGHRAGEDCNGCKPSCRSCVLEYWGGYWWIRWVFCGDRWWWQKIHNRCEIDDILCGPCSDRALLECAHEFMCALADILPRWS